VGARKGGRKTVENIIMGLYATKREGRAENRGRRIGKCYGGECGETGS